MKFFKNSLRKGNQQADADMSVDDSSVYTAGLQSHAGMSLSTQHTSISREFASQRAGKGPSGSDSISAMSGMELHSLGEYSYSHVAPTAAQQAVPATPTSHQHQPRWSMPSHRAKFVGGPLGGGAKEVPLTPETPPLTPIQSSHGSSARSVPPSVTSFRSTESLLASPPASQRKRLGASKSKLAKGFQLWKKAAAPVHAADDLSTDEPHHSSVNLLAQDELSVNLISHDEPSVDLGRKYSDDVCSSPPPPCRELRCASAGMPLVRTEREESACPTPRAGCSRKAQEILQASIPSLVLPCMMTTMTTMTMTTDPPSSSQPKKRQSSLKLLNSSGGRMELSVASSSPPHTPLRKNEGVVLFDDDAAGDLFSYSDDNGKDHDDASCTQGDESTLDFDHGSKLNISDSELMDGRYGSPGQLRLTDDGLRHHTDLRAQENAKELLWYEQTLGKGSGGGFAAWKRQQEQQQYYRGKYEKQDESLERRMERAKLKRETHEKSSSRSTNEQAAPKRDKPVSLVPGALNLLSTRIREEGVEQMSLAPMDTLDLDILEYNPSPSPFGLHKKKLTPRVLLEAERAKQREANNEKQREEEEEFARIQRRREAYLRKQRVIEAAARKERELARQQRHLLKGTTREMPASSSLSKEGGDELTAASASVGNESLVSSLMDNQTLTSLAEETVFSLDTPASDLPCILCGEGERTHIAMPCMHYTFCEDCVVSLQNRRVNVCPCCNTSRVSFTKVFF